MAKLEILEFPDTRLRTKAEPVTDFGDEFQQQVDDMFETMYEAPGIGLAGAQVNYHKRLFVIDVSEDKSEPLVFANPEFVEKRGVEEMEEGCLSFPGVYAKVQRANEVVVKAQDRHGEELKKRGILYTPDYILNAGGIINVSFEENYDRDAALRKVDEIYNTLEEVFATAEKQDKTTNVVADELARKRVAAAKK